MPQTGPGSQEATIGEDGDRLKSESSRYRSALYFVPLLGYVLNLLDYSRLYKVSVVRRLLTVVENTGLYLVAGFLVQSAFRMGSVVMFVLVLSAVWLVAGVVESVAIRMWGERLPRLGWNKLKLLSTRDFLVFMGFMYLQTMSFMLIGSYVAGLLRP